MPMGSSLGKLPPRTVPAGLHAPGARAAPILVPREHRYEPGRSGGWHRDSSTSHADRSLSVAMKKSSRVARSRSPRVATEKLPPLAEPSTTVVPRPGTVAVHTTHRSNRRTLNEISEGENGHGRRLRRRGQLPGRRRHLRRGPEDRQAGRGESPGDVP